MSNLFLRKVGERKIEAQAENDATLEREHGWEKFGRYGSHDQERVRDYERSLKAQGYQTRRVMVSGDIVLERRRSET